jgi:hypothetical protein
VADTVTIPAAELAALRAVVAAALNWADGHTGADPILDAVRAHRPVLDPRDPRDYLAWPEQDREPVPGVDYLPPAGDRWYTRAAEDPDGPAYNRHLIGYSDVDGAHWYDRSGAEVRAA